MTLHQPQEIEVSPVYLATLDAFYDPNVRIIVNEGGTSSSKTYSGMQVFKTLADTFAGKEAKSFEVAGLTVPHLKSGAMQDFKNVLYDFDEYDTAVKHNKTDSIFTFRSGSTVKFSSFEDEGKARGPRRDYLLINEANLFDKDTVKQLMLRTRRKVFMDYNPADEFHWIYDDILTRPECRVIKSTYLDAYDFLEPGQIAEIESLQESDPDLWQVYGLGLRAVGRNKIYPNWEIIDDFPEDIDHQSYGLDFGFSTSATALVRCGMDDKRIVWDQVVYGTHIGNELLAEMMEQAGVRKDLDIYADPAEPDRIEELNNKGFSVLKAKKSVAAGIQFIQGKQIKKDGKTRFTGRKLYITRRSVEMLKEIKSYKFKEVKGIITDQPVKFMDHAMDAGRYGTYTLNLSLYNFYDGAEDSVVLGAY